MRSRKNLLRNLLAAGISLAGASAMASGFSLYEPSVISHAMGGALVGRAMDASANFNNVATLTDLTNIWLTAGFITEHPRCQVRGHTNGNSWRNDQSLDPGFFWLPHFQLAVPVFDGLVFGLSGSAEYGLGTAYDDSWRMNWNSTETTVQGYVINPNLAYKITDDWSVGVGLRWLFFDFEQYKRPYADPTGANSFEYRLKGDNRWETVGWQIGTKYDILDNLSVGLVWKSAMEVDVRGHTSMQVQSTSAVAMGYPSAYERVVRQQLDATAKTYFGPADAPVTIPQSVTGGINWDITPKHHLGFAISWTEWSVMDVLIFNVQPQTNPVYLDWNDTWRGSLGYCWDFGEDWSWMISYVFDMDCCLENDQSSTMLPPAHRHIATTGFRWNCWRNLDLAADYSCIFMDGGSMNTSDSFGNRYHMETCRGFCHAVGFSVTYRF